MVRHVYAEAVRDGLMKQDGRRGKLPEFVTHASSRSAHVLESLGMALTFILDTKIMA